ncbi:unnamed protein product [Linum trigynum]|uniref:DUF4378 domain-containing protein n=1 Tax=Linum trigynum TaxID=586398 RepID=A0AAV2G353_9ROSI
MGKDWYWGGSSKRSKKRVDDRGGGGAGRSEASAGVPSGCMCAVFQLFDLPFATALNQRPSFHFPRHPPPVPKGAEAPRNSLEMAGEEEASVPLAAKQAQNLNIPKIQMGIQIKTTRKGEPGTRLGSGSDSETAASSPATKTPTLVARLMGLDLLPENHSPRSSASSATTPYINGGKLSQLRPQQHQKQQGRQQQQQQQSSHYSHHRRSFDCHELGGGAARNSDADHYHHRLSLQLNKENMTPSEEVVISRIKARLQGRELKPEEETRSPRQYAKQIVKQVKESVSRRVGLDITNTVKNRENPEKRGGRRDSDLVAQIKSRKKKVLPRVAEEEPVDLFPVVKQQNEKPKSVYYRKDHHVLDEMPQSRKQSFSTAEAMFSNPATPVQKINVAVKPRRQGGIISLQEKEQPAVVGKKSRGKRMPPQTSDLIRNKKEEPFVRPTTATRGGNIPDKRCRKTPLSSELPSLILPVKKDPAPPATNLPSPKKQVGLSNAQDSKRSSSPSSQLPSNPSHTASYRLRQEEATRPVPSQENSHQDNDAAATAEAAAEEEYITRILKRTGIDRDTAVSFTNWFSPTHPLDPTIFYHLEHITTATTTPPPASGTVIPPYNRKLIFHLVDEILAGILQPYMNVVPWTTARSSDILNNSDRSVTGSDLVEALCKRIRSFPSADCQVLEDIDALIDKDFSDRPELQWRETAVVEEEVEGILTEVETELLDSLIHETALDIILKAQPNSISPFLGFGAGSRRSHGVT